MFYANPLGIQLDGISTEGHADEYKFDSIWSAAGRMAARYYTLNRPPCKFGELIGPMLCSSF